MNIKKYGLDILPSRSSSVVTSLRIMGARGMFTLVSKMRHNSYGHI